MINLIPPAAKKIMVREYWTRVLSVWLILFGTACVIITCLLLPTYLLINIKTSVLKEQATSATEKMASYDISATELQIANRQAQILLQPSEGPLFTDFVTDFKDKSGIGITISDYKFTRTKTAGSITLSGLANTRQDLADFRDRLEEDERFFKVDLPISNLIKDSNLLFSMTLTLATSTPTS